MNYNVCRSSFAQHAAKHILEKAPTALFDALAFATPTEVEYPSKQSAATYRRTASHIESGCQNIVKQWVKNPPTAS